MPDWTRTFAEHNGVDFHSVNRKVAAVRRRLWLDAVREKARAFRDVYRLEPSFGVRMLDVYEAALVAATIRGVRPNRLRSYRNTLAKRLTGG